MNPQTVQKLLEKQEGAELIAHIVKHVRALDRVSDINLTDDREMAIELLARKRAAEKLLLILQPFLEAPQAESAIEEQEGDIYYNHLPETAKKH